MKIIFAILLFSSSMNLLAQQTTDAQAKELYNNLTICQLYYTDKFMAAMGQYGANQPSKERDHAMEMMEFFEERVIKLLMVNGPHPGNEVNSEIWHDVVGQKGVKKIMKGFTDSQIGQLPALCGELRNKIEK